VQTIIKWQTSLFSKADPVKCYEEITSIGDEVTPKQVVEKGMDPSTELSKCFTKDDSEAAYKWRIEEARHIMRQLIVITKPDKEEEDKEPVQLRVLMKNETKQGSGYKQTIVMVRDEDEYKKLLDQAYEELRRFKRKYSMLSELSEIMDLIN
jgi:hypothetical protein